MNKTTIVNKLSFQSKIFSDASIEDFQTLESSDSSILSTMNERSIKVTPLLKQICDYAFINDTIDDVDANTMLSNVPVRKIRLLSDTMDIINLCDAYFALLFDDLCKHPSFLKVLYKSKAVFLFNCLTDNFDTILSDSEEVTEYIPQRLVVRFLDNGENISDTLFLDVLSKLEKDYFNDTKQLLTYLKNYALNIGDLFGTLDKTYNVYESRENRIIVPRDDNNLLYTRDDNIILPGSVGSVYGQYEAMMDVVYLLNELKMDGIMMDEIKKVNEIYNMYQSYRCNYLKQAYAEAKMIEKCKKL